MQFVLASGSPRRRELLASLGIAFVVIKADIDETQHPGEAPYAYVQRLSNEKAETVAGRLTSDADAARGSKPPATGRKPSSDGWTKDVPSSGVPRQRSEKAFLDIHNEPSVILAADTVVILAADTIGVTETGEILGKPVDADHARTMLERLRGRDHVVCTSLTLRNLATGQAMTELTRTTVTMRDYTDAEIDAYIATGDPFDKAGGYAIQHEGFHPVERIEGSYTNVVGLPVETLGEMLKGIDYNQG